MPNAINERYIFGEATCSNCKHVWACLVPEVAEPPYHCSNCRNINGYISPQWKIYCTIKEDLENTTIWVDGYSRIFKNKTIMDTAE